jgi:solute carrier family 35 (UDP-galactose transporter), member B1
MIILVLLTNELSNSVSLLSVNSQARYDMLILSLSNILGLFFIFLGLSELGPIKLAFLTSSRKVISVLTSIIVFGKSIDFIQGFGIALVLSGMLIENFYSGSKKQTPPADLKIITDKKQK